MGNPKHKINFSSLAKSSTRPCDHLKFAEYQYMIHEIIKKCILFVAKKQILKKSKSGQKMKFFEI